MSPGMRLKKLRKDRKISASELAKDMCCTRQYIHIMERSSNPPSRKMLEKYCEYFNVSADFIMGNDTNSIPVLALLTEEIHDTSSISLPAAFLKEDREYFAVFLGPVNLIILERDTVVHYEKPGVFLYGGTYYFSKLRRYADGSIWLISKEDEKPECVKKIQDLKPIGYQSYQLCE